MTRVLEFVTRDNVKMADSSHVAVASVSFFKDLLRQNNRM